ncbi:MAG: HipA domain-containing protein [Bacteroidia bacterium]|nr:HipA domain-containing protein [Bacteroidia bacterium]
MVFNVIGINNDDHTKNITFLMDQSGRWNLSPAYDVTYVYHPSHKYLSQHQLSVNNKRTGITHDNLLSADEGMNIRKSKDIIEQICEAIKRWPEFAAMAKIPQNQVISIGKTHLIDI